MQMRPALAGELAGVEGHGLRAAADLEVLEDRAKEALMLGRKGTRHFQAASLHLGIARP